MRISDIAQENRPRERLRRGVEKLSDAELLAVIFRTGTKEENVIDMSNRLISTYGIERLRRCSLKELQRIKGIGFAKACQLIAVFEFNKRSRKKIVKITSAEDAADIARARIGEKENECFFVLHLNTKHCVTYEEIVGIGTLDSTSIHQRDVFRSAIRESAHALIIAHNHPSGDPTPSVEDNEVTQRLIAASKVVNIPLIDHIIVSTRSYYSFQESSTLFSNNEE